MKTIELKYRLTDKDYLSHQLYVATESSHVKKTRNRARIFGSLTFAIFSLLFLVLGNYFITISFLIFCPLWFFIYPIWERRYYVKFYKRYINEHYANRINKEVSITISVDEILIKDSSGESKLFSSEITKIVELPLQILLQLKSGASLIIPKRESNSEYLIPDLKSLAKLLKIEYSDKNEWSWK